LKGPVTEKKKKKKKRSQCLSGGTGEKRMGGAPRRFVNELKRGQRTKRGYKGRKKKKGCCWEEGKRTKKFLITKLQKDGGRLGEGNSGDNMEWFRGIRGGQCQVKRNGSVITG